MRKLTHVLFLKLVLSLVFFNVIIQQNSFAQCPVIQFEDLRGVIGFPQFDNTSQCGDPDTLSILVFTDAPGEILGFDLQLNLIDGVQYGGFESTQFGENTSIAYAGGSPTSPKFSLSGVTDPDNVMVANIGIGANCDLDLANLYTVSIDYEFIYQDEFDNIIECEGSYSLGQELNSALKRPELNMNTVSPLTRTLATLGVAGCQTMVVSQDGLQASLGEMNFGVCNVPTTDPNFGIVSIKANGVDASITVEDDSTVVASIDGSYFLGNTSQNPTDEKFNTAEKITFEVCYQSDLCPSQSIFNPVYKAWYGCEGDTCNITSQASTLIIKPTGASDPVATASFSGPVEICGEAATISLTVNNPGGPGIENTYTDLSVGYETCERTNLGIAEVRVGGVALSQDDYEWVGDDLTVHFDSLEMIPGSGLTDADGDGFFDDLEGGATVSLEIDMAIICGVTEVDPTSLDCPSINCPFATFFIEAKSNCGNAFNRFPPVDPFEINYGPTGVSNENEDNIGSTDNPILGYDFGVHGTSASNATPLAPATIDYEFCYDFAASNVSPCPTGAEYGLKLTFAGDARLVQDYEVVPGTMTYSADGGADVSIPDANATFMTPDPSDPGIRMLTVNGGAANDMVCYKMQLQLDTAYCAPVSFVAVSQQVTEYCADCDCTIVKACKNTLFASDPSFYDCPCLIGHEIEVTRKNLGYTDHTMTTKVDRQTILDNCPADLTNFGPGDTMAISVAYDIKDLDAVTNMNMWLFSARVQSTTGTSNSVELPLTPDRRAGGITKWEVVKAGGTASVFSFDDFEECNTGGVKNGFPALSDRGLQDFTTDFEAIHTNAGNSGNDDYDNTINSYFYVRNATQSNECGSVSTSAGGNCLQAFFDAFDFQVGDTIKMYMEFPMKRNPYRAAAIAAGENPILTNGMVVRPQITMYNYDEFGNASYCYTTNSTSCNGFPVVNVAEYGGVSAITELDLDNCGGAAKHTFRVANLPPTGWYGCEFRPIVNLDDIDAPMFGPFAYCGNPLVTDYDGVQTMVAVDSTINSYCTTVASIPGEICATEDAGLGDGKVVFDLASQGIRALGVGLMNDDSLCLSYDLCSLCPAPFTIDYELIYDWSDICDYKRDPLGYVCNSNGASQLARSFCDELGVSGNYYTGLNLDTLQYQLDESSKDFIVNDNRIPDAGMSSSNEGADLIASGAPGSSVEYQEIELCNADDTATQMGVMGSVKLPNSVLLVGVFSDAAGTMPLTTALVSDDGTYKSYSITTTATSLAPGICETVYIGTTLLFCPELPAPPPQICVSAVSGCAPADVTSALAGNGTCGSGEDCYAYISGEADLQTEWYNTPEMADLCMTDTFYIRVKNTKQLTLLDLETVVNVPPGVNIVSGSWEAAYPGGKLGLTGNFGAWTPISPQPLANGTSYSFSDEDYNADIANSGLKGVFSMADSNNVSFRFIATTECDNFISGSKFTTETTASDPCGPNMLMSGQVESPPLIINGADPLENAQILTTAQPTQAYCTGGPTTFGLTALNISENPTSDVVETCLTIPMESLTYVSGSVSFTSPNYTPATVSEDVVGDNMVVCFDSPALMPGQKFSLQFMGDQPAAALCGPIMVGMDVKSFEAAVECESAPGMSCGVFVQNSINSAVLIEMGPPLETVDVRLNRHCNAGTDPEQFCYEIDMVNPGDVNYTGNIRVGIHDDVLADGIYNEIVDAELAGFDHAAVSVDAGAMVTIMMCIDVPAAQACPILLRQSFETGCACDEAITPFDNIPPAFLDTIECKVLCAGEAFLTDICGDYEFTLEPAEGGTIVSDGSTLSVTLNAGFGVDAPVVLTATEAIGDCISEATLELKSTGDYAPENLAFQVCEGECIDPDLMIPANIADGSVIEITQVGTATIGSDLDMSDPEICGMTPGMTDTYTVTITANPTCVYTFDFTVEVLPIGVLALTDAEVCNHPIYGGTIEADPTFDNYQFFIVLPNGAEVLKYSGPLNTYNTMDEGDYVVKATRAVDLCPSVTTASISSDHCVDLALTKVIEAIVPGPYPTTGGTVEYKLSVTNQGGVEMNQIELTDFVPEGLTNNDPNWTPIGMTNGIVTRVVPTPGFASGDVVDVSIVLTVNPGASFDNTINIAEISAMQDVDNNDVSDEDIDSTPDTDPSNDPGGNPNTGSDNVIDGDGANGGGANGDEDPLTDEDDNDPATLPVFDLALTKTVDPSSVPASGMFTVGDDIIFFINVINQGSIDATEVVITDLIPCGMEMFDETDIVNSGEGWGAAVASANASSGFETQMTISSLPAGGIMIIPIKMTLAVPTGGTGHTPCMAGMDSYINYSYIDSALDGMGMVTVDIDSNPGTFTTEEEGTMPNAGGDNDTNSTGNNGTGSEDDSDPANIEIFDLALSKILNPDNGPYAYGETATFEICVTNQGNVPSDNIQIVDYIPAGYMFAPTNDPKWTDNGDGTATYQTDAADFVGTSMPGQIEFLEQVCTSIDLIVQAGSGDPTAYINTAEIAGANTVTDDGSGPVSTPVNADNDGPFDTDPTNDAGGALDTPSDAMTSDSNDPAIQGNGTGANGDEDPLTDSDDADIATIDIVDFALTKTIASPDAPYAYGDTITYNITVFNQGTVTGMNITVTDYAPVGLEYIASPIINPGWTGVSASHMYMINEMIAPSDSVVVPIKIIVTANGTTAADYTNIAEIFSVFDEDGVNITNDDVDSQPNGNPFDDAGGAADTESDNVVTGTGLDENGDPNAANGSEDPLTDEDDNDPAFVQIFDLAQTKEIVGGPYTIGDLVEYKITTLNQGNAPVTNVVVNDYVPAGLVFSLADNADWMFVGANPTGNTIRTTITDVIMPGEMVMTSLFLTIQSANGDPNAYTNYTEISSFEDTNGNSSIDDPTIADADSTPDDDPENDAGGNPNSDSDDSVDGDGSGDPLDEDASTDEDDQDPAMLSIPDLALIKTTAEEGPFSYGDIVTFDISVVNQGNVVASNVEVTDYVPSGFIYELSNDPLWDYDGTVATTVIEGPVNPGDSIVVSIDLMVTQVTDPANAYTNEAEISEAFEEDGTTPFDDVDSNADDNNTNDAGGAPLSDSDNALDGTGTNGTGAPDDTDAATDEDDADPELIEVVDVAQTKMLVTAAPYEYGQELEFTLTTYNQGNVPLTDVVITDYIPAGFSLSETSEDAGWALAAAGAEYTITDVILPGESVETTIFLVLEMTTGGTDDYTNVSEVSMMSDTTGVDVSMNDADSDINNDPTDNGGGEPNSDSDDVVDGDGTGAPGDEDATTDEDNSDPAFVEIFDLAVIMENSTDQITMYGQDITFPVTLTNQGNVDSDMPEVTVMVPDGFVFDEAANPDWTLNMDGTVTYVYDGILAPGDLEMFDLVLTSQPGTDSDSWTPVVAITADNPISDTPGLMDIDSDIDGDPTNDAGGNELPDTGDDPDGVVGSDDSLTGDGSGSPDDTDASTDSDASDPEFVRIVDVAQTKTLITEGPYTYGQLLEFEVTTYNQGNVPLTDVVVTDYIPEGFAYDASSDAEGWEDQMDGTATTTIAGPIVIGTPEVTTIYMTLEMTTGGEDNYTNVSEVTSMTDGITGDDITGDDVDSELNDDPTDNGGGAPGTDSDDVVDGDGTGAPGDEDEDTDEDNSDPALVEIFDLAIIMGASTDTLTMYGQDVTFPITLTNQGNVDSEMPVFTVMVPDGFIFDLSNNPGWVDNEDGTVSYTYPDTLEPGDLDMIDLVLTSQQAEGADAWTPVVEITEDNAANGDDDIDSNPDTTFDDDAGGAADPDSEDGNFPGSDDILTGDGTGTAGDTDAAGDEDDNDPELVNIFDLALTKVTMMTTGNSFGDQIEFMITVYNQGNIPATNVEVTDFMPDGFGYVAANDDAGWEFDPVLMTSTITVTDVIEPGESITLSYFVTIMMSDMGDAFQNQAEISEAEDENGNSTEDGTLTDADSTPDDINGNDAGGEPGTDSDNAVDGDASGTPGDGNADTDEDDSDPALIQVIDVAIQKTIVEGQAPFAYGTPVDFLVKVINQGNEPLVDVQVTDYIPTGYTYDPASDANGWSYDVVTGHATAVIEGPMVQWDEEDLIITLIPTQVIPSDDATAWTNVAEVSQMFNEDGMDISLLDIDSQSDNIPNNDPGGEPDTDSDDALNGDGNNGGGIPGDEDANSDEDDADPALLPVFDLALTKQLAFPDSLYVFGNEMEFVIEITNQGNQPVTDVIVTDYIPGSLTDTGVAGDNTGWMFNGATADYTITDVLDPGESIEVTLFMIFQPAAGGIEEYVNVAEISQFADTEGNNSTDNPDIVADADSSPDTMEDNDAGGDPDFPGSPSGTDNTIDNENGDEDDQDPVLLGFVDMALAKTLVDPTTPVQVGMDVTFEIEVTNQGTIPMIDVEVIDYIPAGFELSVNDANDWEPTVDGNVTNTIAGPLGFSESATLEIVLTVLPDAQAEDMINVAELTEFFFESGDEATDFDIDSEADDTNGDDAGGDVYGDSNDAVDGDGTGNPGDSDPLTDEDDADPAVPNVLDLALAKTIDPATPAVRPGDLVTFMIEVCNQGNIPVEGVTVHDEVPVGLLKVPVASDGWNLVDGNTWAFVIEDRLLPETCTTIEIELEVLANSSAADMINVAEITEVIDTNGVDVSAFDIDSTPNDDDGEAAGTLGTDDDDSVDGQVPAGEDSDDADPAAPPVMDLAIQKINPVVGPSERGDVIPFEITVYNQGNLGADIISIWDYVPAGLEFIPGLNPDWTEQVADEAYVLQYNDGLAPGESVTFVINLEVRQTATPMNVVNMTEIAAVIDENGVLYDASSGTFDYDSDFDFSNTNDVGNDLYDFENDNVLDEYGIGHGADGVDDEDDHDQAWVLLCDGISCEGTLNISLDENCMTTLTPSMFLTGDIFPDHVYELEIVGEDGAIHPNMFDGSDVGSSFTVSVINPLCLGNSCWMTVYLEDKLAPEIVCQDVTISCNGVGNIPEPTVVDQCGNVEIILIDEIKTPLDCDDNFVSMIERTYIGRDSAGNESEPCTQTIMLERVTVGIITPPEPFLLPNNNLTCGSGFATDENGNPHVSVTGVPTTGGENYLVTTAEFDYIDISTTGTRVLSGDDTGVEVVLGSAFDVYGMNFTSVGVSTNGYITTDIADSGIDWSNDCPLPTNPGSPAETTGARIYPLHDDLDADLSQDPNAGVFYEYFAVSPVEPPSGAMTGVSVFQWKVDHFNAAGLAELDFQALLFDNGEIVYQYNVIGTEMGSGASVGIQSMAQEDNSMPQYGTEISCNEVGSVIAGTAVGLAPPGPVVDLFPFDNSIFCSGFSEYEDQVLFDDGCTKKIMRKFTIGEWHCNTTNEVFIFQMIDIVDDQAPSVTAPADMTVSTATFSCSASVELPAATVSDVCNDVTVDIAYPEGFIDNQNGGLAILPVGEHIVTYTAYDACGNSSSDVMSVTVADQSDPIALCDGFDVVSIGTGNSASLTAIALDDGSFDECGGVTLSVARMDDPGFDDGSAFAPAVEFDCSDIGEEIMVALLVTDMGGNTNMCMVQVEVQDKIDAFISCPADVTVDCTTPYDLNNLDSFGVPTITDNCTETEYEETVVSDFNECGVGSIIRTFTVMDNGARTCTQVISFENQSDPFGEDDIEWPLDYIAPNGCVEADLSPAGLDAIDADFGFPVVEDMSTCILTGDSFTDEEFIGGGGACRTIYRTWKVIDWCSPRPDGSFPTFEHTQLIEINNVTAPAFISSTELITVESYAADCEAPVPVEGLTAEAQDDCTPDASLIYTYIVDLNNDDTNDIAGLGPDASGTYPLGTHSVRFTVTDGCGNVAFLERLFTIVNLKTATAYCLDNVSVNLTPWDSDGDGTPDMEMATITPDLIDGGSFHSCGYDIQLSFSADVNDTELLVSCDDIGEVDIELWVTDENGNADFCTTTIEVQDNNDVDICDPNSEIVSVEGLIYTEDSEEVESVQVGLMGADVIYDMTEETGEYAFNDMPVGGDYMVLPYKNDDHGNGVSTLDLVLIQRHILGLGDLDSPYKMIAADVNYSQNISASDIVILRKVILGVYEEFPSNNSWRFIDAEYNFPDTSDPWLGNLPEDYEITTLDSDMNIDFIGVKTGDVNGSVTANAQSNTTEVRSDNTWSLSMDDKQVRVGELVKVEVKSTDAAKVFGWQYSLETEDLSLVSVTPAKANVSSQNINDDRGTIHMSYGEANGLDVGVDEVLYTITLQAAKAGKLSEMISINDRGLRAESYHTDMDINSIEIRWNTTEEEPVIMEEFSVAQNEPNPWYDKTTVSYFIPQGGDVRFIVKDVAGRTLYSTSSYREAGKHTQAIESRFLEANGVLLYEVHYDDQVISNRMIHIK